MLLLLIIGALQFPAVQTKVTSKVADTLSKQWGTTVSVGKVNLQFFETVNIQDVYIEDQQADTLLYAGSITADIGLFNLFQRKIMLDKVTLEDIYAHIERPKDGPFNYQFIVDSLNSTPPDTTKQSAPWDFGLTKAELRNIRFVMNDDSAETTIYTSLSSLEGDLRSLGMESGTVEANYLRVDGLVYRMTLPASEPTPDTTSVEEAVAVADTSVLIPGMNYLADEFSITNSSFYFRQGPERPVNDGMDFTNLDLQDITILLKDIKVAGDTLMGKAEQMAAYEANTDFRLSDFAFDLNMRFPSMEGTISKLRTGKSYIDGEIQVALTNMLDPDKLMTSSRGEIDLKKSHFDLEELSVFLPMLDTMPEIKYRNINLAGLIKLNEGQATISDLVLNMPGAIDLNLSARANNIADIDNLQYTLDLSRLSVSTKFLQQYLKTDSLPPGIGRDERLRMSAKASGSLKRSDIEAVLRSTTGTLRADVVYRQPSEGSFSVDGRVNADRFNLRPILGDSSGFGETTMAADVIINSTPQAFTVDTAKVKVAELVFNNYTYKDLNVTASLKDSLALFTADYADSMLIFDLFGKANLAKNEERYQLNGRIEEANLFRLNLTPDSIIAKTNINMDFRGAIPDDMTGELVLNETEIIKGYRRYDMDSIRLFAEKTDSGRLIAMRSGFADMNLYGDYEIAQIANGLSHNIHFYLTNYPYDTSLVLPDQHFVLDLDVKENPVITKIFMPDLEIPEPLAMRFEFRMDERMIDLQLDAPKVFFAGDSIINLRVQSVTRDKAITFGVSADMIIAAGLSVPDLATTGVLKTDELDFTLALANDENPNRLRLNSLMYVNGDTVTLDVASSSVFLEGERWNISQDAYLEYHPEYILIDDFSLANNDQSLTIFTEENGTDPELVAEIDNLGIGNFLNLLDLGNYGVNGRLNGQVNIVNPLKMKSAEANMSIDSLEVDEAPAGRMLISASTTEPQKIKTEVRLAESLNTFLLTGVYDAADSTNMLDFNLDMNFDDISQWAVFANEVVREVSGGIAAKLDIEGNLLQPSIEGYFQLKNGLSFRPLILGGLFTVEDQKINVDNQSIDLNEIVIRDESGKKATLTGSISHDYFTDFQLDNQLSADNFTFIDKPEDEEALFYGYLLADANVTIKGPLENLVVDGDFTSLPETNFSFNLPQDPATIVDPDWITYFNGNAFVEADTMLLGGDYDPDFSRVELTGIRLTSRIQLSEGTQVNIVIDPQNDDVIKAVGEGEFIFGMDEDGQMQLQGTLILSSGEYTLNFGGLVKREFDVREGSSITWTGDPLKAEMNLAAIYTTEASRGALINANLDAPTQVETQTSEVKMPVDVVLQIRGSILEPELDFDIQIPEEESGVIGNQIVQKIESIRQNESELYRQIFGLVVLGRFLPDEGFGNGGDSNFANTVNARINSSVSALLTSQLNRLGTDYLGGIEFDLDVTSSPYATGTAVDNRIVDLSVKKSLFDERITVAVGGTSDLGGSAATNSNAAFLGSFTVFYRLDQTGNLTLKLYQDNDLDIFTQQVQQRSGASLLYIKRFDTIKNFFGSSEKEKREEKKDKENRKVEDAVTREREINPSGLRRQ